MIDWLELTLPTIEENLALDEALLVQAEQGEGGAVLRFWELPRPAVVLGMNGRVSEEVYQGACGRDDVALARRCSGGGTVVLAPGCLVFSLVLPGDGILDVRRSVHGVLQRLADTLRTDGLEVALAGVSDLIWHNRKVSGNAQRHLRCYFLHHGTLLYDFDAELAERYLPLPTRIPAYRQGRSHRDFLTNLPVQRDELLGMVRQAFGASVLRRDWPALLTQQLVREKYSRPEWLTRR